MTAKPTLTPEEPLAAFIGEDPNGTWTLTIGDDGATDAGTLASWGFVLRARRVRHAGRVGRGRQSQYSA